ncbi:nitrate ABC transporter substrate-binding protein [Streptomyces mirabilis]|uniref:ABC transporter substrate-binding protein n=1 Tax=Streptomyces mirabilis TaxID=68239 RepID=UPI00167D4392|nr:ABC transporter substrate-binding protein [Streptomyces mirabilis]GHD67023.1 nitrate ABC transporter substrate-binding protein [Streptomyces mirabilis]
MPISVRRSLVAGLSASFLLAATGCGAGATTAGSAADLKSAPAAQRLDKVCPATVVVQADWEPEAEHGPIYNLVGPGYTVDTDKKRVTGPLVIGGKDTGVKIQVRAGGSAVGFQSPASEMYIDQSITLGMVTTDGAIQAAGKQPVTAVAALMKKSPQVLMWDPKTHPDWKTVADIGKSGAKVVYRDGEVFAPMLVAKGLIKKSQLDGSYDSSPSRFVADPSIAQQGFATAEPYIYEHEVAAWKKPVKFQLLSDVGYTVYPEALSVRTGALKKLSPCLKKLVPVIQQSAADFANAPDTAVALIDDIVKQYGTSWVYSKGTGQYAAKEMVRLGILGNEADGSIASFDKKRVADSLKTFGPILTKGGGKIPAGLSADDLATNAFIDTKIGMK